MRCSRSSAETCSFAPQIGRRAPRRSSLRSIVTALREVGIVFEEHDRGHHFRDAGDRPLVLGVLLEQDLAGLRVQTIAAAARTSGMTAPEASVVNCGVSASRNARSREEARARASRARRARAARDESRFVDARRTVFFFVVELLAVVPEGAAVAASETAGRAGPAMPKLSSAVSRRPGQSRRLGRTLAPRTCHS